MAVGHFDFVNLLIVSQDGFRIRLLSGLVLPFEVCLDQQSGCYVKIIVACLIFPHSSDARRWLSTHLYSPKDESSTSSPISLSNTVTTTKCDPIAVSLFPFSDLPAFFPLPKLPLIHQIESDSFVALTGLCSDSLPSIGRIKCFFLGYLGFKNFAFSF